MSFTSTRKVSKDYAYFEIKKRIISGEMKPDQNVVEEFWANELEISKTPLREALQKLEMEELVIRQANGRLKVASISEQEVGEIFLVRSYLEGIITKQAAMNATERDLETLANYCKQIIDSSAKGLEDDVLYYGSQFHIHLYEISGNKTATKLLGMLNDHVSRYRRLVPSLQQARIKDDIEDHERILAYISEKDVAGAELAMREHILRSMELAIEAIKKYQEEKEKKEIGN